MDDAQKAAARDRAKDRLFDNILRLEDEAARLRTELDEQCRLLGMGSEREARLMAQLAESQARELRMREALTAVVVRMREVPAVQGDEFADLGAQARSAMNLRGDDSALREMIEAAKAEEREAIFCSVEQTWYAQGLDVRGASVSDFLAAIRARNADKPTGLSERVMTIFAQMQAVSHGRARKG